MTTDEHRAQVSAWLAAEERLYPVVMVRPEAYARSLELVRAIVDELAGVGSVQGLVDAFAAAADIAAAAATSGGVRIDDLDLGLVAGAAFALRYREVVREVALAEAAERITTARQRGDRWALVSESGDPDRIPYVRTEMRLPGGEAIRIAAEADAETGRPRYLIETFALDPTTGQARDVPNQDATRASFDDRVAWQQAYERLRADREGAV